MAGNSLKLTFNTFFEPRTGEIGNLENYNTAINTEYILEKPKSKSFSI